MPKYYQIDRNTWSKHPTRDTDPVVETEIDIEDLKWLDGDLFDIEIVGKSLLDAHVSPRDVLSAVNRVLDGSKQVPIPWENETDSEFHDDEDVFDALTRKFVEKDSFIKALIDNGYAGFRRDNEFEFFDQTLLDYLTHAQGEGMLFVWRQGRVSGKEAIASKRQGANTPVLYKCQDDFLAVNDLVLVNDMPLYMRDHTPIKIVGYSTDQIEDLLEY
jgi:hypothetical protein